MPRAIRIRFENAWYHVMNRGAARKQIFQSDEQRLYFLDLLEQCYELFNLEIHAYCLMGNHFHLLVKTPRPSLSEAMWFLCASYARKFNRQNKIDGPLFRGRFKAIVIDAEDYLVQVSRYIHRNPVEAKLVDSPSEFVWSSYAGYRNPSTAPAWLTTKEILRRMGAQTCFGDYCRFVENDSYPSMREFYNSRRVPGVLGSKEFRHYVSGFGFPDAAPKTGAKVIGSAETIKTEIARFLHIPPEKIIESVPGRANPGRLIAIHLVEKLSGLSSAEIAECFGLKQSTLAVTLCKLRAKVSNDHEFAKTLEDIERYVRESHAREMST
jgi:REP element-mobilizing transposase RayT